MRRYIEDFALIGDLHTAALVGRDGKIEWLCVPRFDSSSAFASLVSDDSFGCWLLEPEQTVVESRRRYIGPTLVLETTLRTADGCVRLIDFMPRRDDAPTIVRIVEGVEGNVHMRMHLACRFSYGRLPPWTRPLGDAVTMTVGGDAMALRSSVELDVQRPDVLAHFEMRAGHNESFVLQWYPAHEKPPKPRDATRAYHGSLNRWHDWSNLCSYTGEYYQQVLRSVIVLKALTYEPTGGCIAAVTTSLPEKLGGARNWDYRYAWVRDSAVTIKALVATGYCEEARAWRDWLLRMIAGDPSQLQIMYTVTGEPRIAEYEADWLAGYEHSRPVRIGNAAYEQFQLGVYGEAMQAIFKAHEAGIEIDEEAWAMLRQMLHYLGQHWSDPDHGIWESRRKPLHYTHSRIMAWLAFDCAVRLMERDGYDGPLEEWRALRSRIHDDVMTNGFSRKRNAFVQAYENEELDASLLGAPLVGFLPADHERIRGTLDAIERELCIDGLVMRRTTDIKRRKNGNLELQEGSFMLCNFWLVQDLVLTGRRDRARALFERLLGLANDVGLLSEEYDVQARRLVGNVPQTFSHAALVTAATALSEAMVPAERSSR
jgi:GH15 family glucan-1,4-alpha-glucosidase